MTKNKKRFTNKKLFLAMLALLVSGFVGTTIWFQCQPPILKHEMKFLVSNFIGNSKKITISEVIYDIWAIYFSDDFIGLPEINNLNIPEEPIIAGVPDDANFKYSIKVLKNDAFWVGYCHELKNPVWVAYKLTNPDGWQDIGKRPSSFKTDYRTKSKVKGKDYRKSGYDRGHLAPNFAIALCHGREAQLQTFTMSNISPQTSKLNSGIWRWLESTIAINNLGRFEDLWIITGPIFDDPPSFMQNQIAVPTAFFKIICDKSAGRIRTSSFVIPQQCGKRLKSYQVSINQIEEKTGLNFFSILDDQLEEKIEMRVNKRPW